MLEGCGMLRRAERTKLVGPRRHSKVPNWECLPFEGTPLPPVLCNQLVSGKFRFYLCNSTTCGQNLEPNVLAVPAVLSSGIATALPVRRMTGTEEPAQGQMSLETAVSLW